MRATPEIPAPLEQITEAFELLPDWQERYRYLIELGRELPPLSAEEQCADNKVTGCMSQVWLVAERVIGPPDRMRYRADSDAHIVKGLIAVLLAMFHDRTVEEVLALDARRVLDDLGLAGHLSMGRRNGLESMVRRIKEHAAAG